jgi:hypothetical protein
MPNQRINNTSGNTPSGIIFNSIHNYLEIMFAINVLRFPEFRTMRNHLSETLMLNDIQITSDYMSRWVVLKRCPLSVRPLSLLTIVLSVLLLYSDFDYPFGIFKLFFRHDSNR